MNESITQLIPPEAEPLQGIEIVGSKHKLFNTENTLGWPEGTIDYIRESKPDLLTVDGAYGPEEGDQRAYVLHMARDIGIDQQHLMFADPGVIPSVDVHKQLLRNTTEVIAENAISLATVGALIYALSSDKILDLKTSRRNFMIGSVIAANSIKLAMRAIPSLLLDHTDNRATRDAMQKLYSLGGPLLTRSKWWIDGRTAVMIQKNLETDAQRTQILLGTGHLAYADQILHDDSFREDLIIDYMANVNEGLMPYSPANKEELKIQVAKECARAEIHRYDKAKDDLRYVTGWHSDRIMQLSGVPKESW